MGLSIRDLVPELCRSFYIERRPFCLKPGPSEPSKDGAS